MRSEKSVQNEIMNYLLSLGFNVIRFNSGAAHTPNGYVNFYKWHKLDEKTVSAGVPDLFVFGDGKSFFCEVKSEVGELSPVQKRFQSECKKNGVRYLVARCLEDLTYFLEHFTENDV